MKKLSRNRKTRLRTMAQRKKKQLLARQGAKCRYCTGTEDLSVDHVRPISKGGRSNIENLAIVCKKCNVEKSSMNHEEYVLYLEKKCRDLRGIPVTRVRRKKKRNWLLDKEAA